MRFVARPGGITLWRLHPHGFGKHRQRTNYHDQSRTRQTHQGQSRHTDEQGNTNHHAQHPCSDPNPWLGGAIEQEPEAGLRDAEQILRHPQVEQLPTRQHQGQGGHCEDHPERPTGGISRTLELHAEQEILGPIQNRAEAHCRHESEANPRSTLQAKSGGVRLRPSDRGEPLGRTGQQCQQQQGDDEDSPQPVGDAGDGGLSAGLAPLEKQQAECCAGPREFEAEQVYRVPSCVRDLDRKQCQPDHRCGADHRQEGALGQQIHRLADAPPHDLGSSQHRGRGRGQLAGSVEPGSG